MGDHGHTPHGPPKSPDELSREAWERVKPKFAFVGIVVAAVWCGGWYLTAVLASVLKTLCAMSALWDALMALSWWEYDYSYERCTFHTFEHVEQLTPIPSFYDVGAFIGLVTGVILAITYLERRGRRSRG